MEVCNIIWFMFNKNRGDDYTTPSLRPKNKSTFWETVKFALIAIIIVWPIRTFIAQPFIVSGNSMVPTFENNQYLIVDQLSYRFHEPKRGDVVVFKYPNDTTKFFIKRIIGLPNETVIIDGSKISIRLTNGEVIEIEEPYVKNEGKNTMEIDINSDEYFVMGDNRIASSDSRFWGNLKRDLIVGKAFVRLLPLNHLDINPGSYHYNFDN